MRPSTPTRVLLDLAQSASSYFAAGNKDRAKRILIESDPGLRAARLVLVEAVGNVLELGLSLLRVAAPEAR